MRLLHSGSRNLAMRAFRTLDVVWEVSVAIAQSGTKREHKSSLVRRKDGQDIFVSLCKKWGAESFRGVCCVDGKLRSRLSKISTGQLKQSCRRSVSPAVT